MTSDPKNTKQREPQKEAAGQKKADKKGQPEWAGGLRQLYNSVVEEPLPDSFKDLLAKLDDGE